MAMLYADEMLVVQEQVCTARAPTEGKQFSQSIAKWRAANQALLGELQQAAVDVEQSAYEKLKNPESSNSLQSGVGALLALTGAQPLGATAVLNTFAKLNDAQAKSMCATYAHQATNESWLRTEMQSALKLAASLH
ncbi:hypothetical protein [Niveibacterium microcysteis]|uniref:DUF892 family protein n=1 Tax=Niveibacterium microcysteis TaxID=2811415 RepID=A0ABX7M4I3_9RHOO|nr:hypothetical protein [Niveibacterium microcysteis]QSI76656.1 hypothetical protein JY500_19695 [Niveibacterium microcysteis]